MRRKFGLVNLKVYFAFAVKIVTSKTAHFRFR